MPAKTLQAEQTPEQTLARQTLARQTLNALMAAAIKAAQPATCLPTDLPKAGKRTVVIGAGKASAAMAQALELAWAKAGQAPLSGVVVVPSGYECACKQITIITASHPVPDARSVQAAKQIKQAVAGLGKDDLVIALISGGGSALITEPIAGVCLAQKQQITQDLLLGGATIQEINTVRKQLSQIKGGQLAAAVGAARLQTWLISDVPGDNPSFIASGPTVADSSTPKEAIALLNRYLGQVPSEVLRALQQKQPRATPVKGVVKMLGSPLRSLNAAAKVAQELGYTPLILGDALEGESQAVGLMMAGIAKSVYQHGLPIKAPAVLLSGGETTVTHITKSKISKGKTGEGKTSKGKTGKGKTGKGKTGKGGPNQEFLLGLLAGLDAHPHIHALAIDTDGKDGSEPVAGAFVAPNTLARAKNGGLDFLQACADHDSFTFFSGLGDLIDTGPTFTNVNDFRAVLIEA